MKKIIPALIATFFVFSLIQSCKLDPPILPGDKGYVQQYPPGSGATGSTGTTGTTGSTGATGSTGSTGSTGATGSTGSLGTSPISGIWVVKSTTGIQIVAGQTSTATMSDDFSMVIINDIAKTGEFKDLTTASGQTTFAYTLTGSGSNETIAFAHDPFGRPDNSLIKITSVTSTSMTWIAVDPSSTSTYTFEYQVIMQKQ